MVIKKTLVALKASPANGLAVSTAQNCATPSGVTGVLTKSANKAARGPERDTHPVKIARRKPASEPHRSRRSSSELTCTRKIEKRKSAGGITSQAEISRRGTVPET